MSDRDSLNPSFKEELMLDYFFEENQQMELSVYHSEASHVPKEDGRLLNSKFLIGKAIFSLGDLVSSNRGVMKTQIMANNGTVRNSAGNSSLAFLGVARLSQSSRLSIVAHLEMRSCRRTQRQYNSSIRGFGAGQKALLVEAIPFSGSLSHARRLQLAECLSNGGEISLPRFFNFPFLITPGVFPLRSPFEGHHVQFGSHFNCKFTSCATTTPKEHFVSPCTMAETGRKH
jgi:hypothetical protein